MTQPDYDQVTKITIDAWKQAGSPDQMSGNTKLEGHSFGFLIEYDNDGITDISIYDRPMDEVEDIGNPAHEAAIWTQEPNDPNP